VNPKLSEELAQQGFAIVPAALPLRHVDEIAIRLESLESDGPGLAEREASTPALNRLF
jgi:hypothetical protein